MGPSFLGCLGRAAALVVLVAIVWLAWQRGPQLWESVRDAPAELPLGIPEEELAQQVLARYQMLADGEVDRLALSAAELQSTLRHSLSDRLPEGVEDLSVRLEDSEARLGARVALDHLPVAAELERVRAILPDPVPIELRGVLVTLEDGQALFLVRRIDAGGIPLPRSIYSGLVESLDPGDRGPLPPEAVRVPLPTGTGSVYIDGDRLVLTGPD